MPEAPVMESTTTTETAPSTTTTTSITDSGTAPSLGWRAGLPDDLKQNTDLASYKTVGDFTKDALQWKAKSSELEGKLGEYIPKLPDDATDEERGLYYDALGRPPKASEYEFDGEDKNAPEWTSYWKDQFYGMGLTKSQAKALSTSFNGQIQKMVEAHNNMVKAEMETASQKLRTELGDKYDTSVELAQRLAKNKVGDSFDNRFAALDANGKQMVIELTLKYAALTGEDTSPQGGQPDKASVKAGGFAYPNSPNMPKGVSS